MQKGFGKLEWREQATSILKEGEKLVAKKNSQEEKKINKERTIAMLAIIGDLELMLVETTPSTHYRK